MNATSTSSSESAAVVVAGDVCLDVLGYPIPPSPKSGSSTEENWRQTGETRTFYRRGGAWLLADFLRAAVKATAWNGKVVEPVPTEKSEADFERLTRQQIVHSLLSLKDFPDSVANKGSRIRVAETHGFSGPDESKDTSKPNYPTLKLELPGDVANPDLVILDDTGNRFRHQQDLWPLAITTPSADGPRPLILYKLHRPLPLPKPALPNTQVTNQLWQTIRSVHGQNKVVVVSVDDLREAGAVISRRLSWERTALELVWQLNGGAGSDRLSELRQCPHLIVRLGLEGAIYWCNPGNDQAPRAWLVYDPTAIEGDWDDQHAGTMVGFGSAFLAGLAATLLAPESRSEFQQLRDSSPCDFLPQLRRGVKRGLLASRHLLSIGYGTPQKGQEPAPAYLADQVFAALSDKDEATFATVSIPISSDLLDPDPGRWSILNTQLPGGSDLDTAAEALATLKKPTEDSAVGTKLAAIPRGVFGKLTTYDRNEIEAYRAVSNVVREYLGQLAPKRPLCLAVFGPPGSGKSFGVEQVAVSIAERTGAKIAKLTFNLSQFTGVDDLNRSLHLVRDAVLKGSVPLVFFDEFDSSEGDKKLVWLKLLLAPMQDGEFFDQGAIHPLGRAIFVFAGGTAASYAAFVPQQFQTGGTESDAWRDFRAAKGPDFISRLRGVLDIPGIEIRGTRDRGAALLRRAGILRFQLLDRARHLFDTAGNLQIDPAVLKAILQVRSFHHGIRSLEALLDMSQLAGRACLDPGSLPHPAQMQLHVDAADFLSLLHTGISLATQREDIARALHADYLATEETAGRLNPAQPSHRSWEDLSEHYRESNRQQADDIPRKLKLAGFYLRKGITPTVSNAEFDSAIIETIAQAEHDRWMREKYAAGWNYDKERDNAKLLHPDLVPWSKLGPDAKSKDLRFATILPKLLGDLGWEIVPLPSPSVGWTPTSVQV